MRRFVVAQLLGCWEGLFGVALRFAGSILRPVNFDEAVAELGLRSNGTFLALFILNGFLA